jgi:hypothetical protein
MGRKDSLFNLTQTVGGFEVKCRQIITPCLPLSQRGISGLETGGHKKWRHVTLARGILGTVGSLHLEEKHPCFMRKMTRHRKDDKARSGYIT